MKFDLNEAIMMKPENTPFLQPDGSITTLRAAFLNIRKNTVFEDIAKEQPFFDRFCDIICLTEPASNRYLNHEIELTAPESALIQKWIGKTPFTAIFVNELVKTLNGKYLTKSQEKSEHPSNNNNDVPKKAKVKQD